MLFGIKSHYSLQALSLSARYQRRGPKLSRHIKTVQLYKDEIKCWPSLNCVFKSSTHTLWHMAIVGQVCNISANEVK